VTAEVTGQLADPVIALTARSGRIATAGRILEGLSLDARIEAPATAPRAEVSLEASLDGQPLNLALRGRPEETLLRLEQAILRLGPAVLTADGLIDPDALLFDGTARLEASALAPLAQIAGVEGLEGRLDARGVFERRDGVQGFDLTLEAPRLALAGVSGRLQVNAEGTPQALAWAVDAASDQGSATARGRVDAVDQGWQAGSTLPRLPGWSSGRMAASSLTGRWRWLSRAADGSRHPGGGGPSGPTSPPPCPRFPPPWPGASCRTCRRRARSPARCG
jgi:autotransporter translocation and assembly factor TamB